MSSDQFRSGHSLELLLDFGAFNSALRSTDLSTCYKKLLTTVATGRQLRRATIYVALEGQSTEQRQLLSAARNSGYRIVGKPLKPLSDGSMRGYLGVDMAVDAVLASNTSDIVTVVTGDPHFLPAIHAMQANGTRVELIGCPGQTLDSLRDAADSFAMLASVLPLTQAPEDRKRKLPPIPPQQPKEWPTPPPPPPEPPSRSETISRLATPTSFQILDGEHLSGIADNAQRRHPRGRKKDSSHNA